MTADRAGTGWQTLLADLSLILFMLTTATLSQAQDGAGGGAGGAAAPSPVAEPVAIYAASAGAEPLAAWLAAQSPDRRQNLTIHARYQPGGEAAALADALRLLRAGGPAAKGARIIVEPGARAAPAAVLAYDAPPDPVNGARR